MDRAGLLTLCAYNAYANRLVMNVVQCLSAAELARPVSPSHESVQKLMEHMLGLEATFLARCQGTSPDWPDSPALAALIRYWGEVEQTTHDFITGLTEDDLAREVRPFSQQTLHFPVWQLLLQIFMHSAHHRGELSVVLTELGHPLPTLDIILHFVEQSGQVWPSR